MNEVNAQQARAVIDLLVGYKLSRLVYGNILKLIKKVYQQESSICTVKSFGTT